jgi:2-keto-4-pentenoate hydratase/2-oxohepta-3-ene-1,7-dioic acid hydratase in catechol pathway
MRVGTLRTPTGGVPALVLGERAVSLVMACRLAGERLNNVTDVLSLIEQWEMVRDTVDRVDGVVGTMVSSGEVEGAPLTALGPPILRPGKVIGIGRNYADHAAETGHAPPPEPMIFAKFATAVTGPFDPIPRPAFVADLDYEAELAVVIGRGGRDIAESDALDHVFGYCCANDVSARTAQNLTGQFVRGKSFDGFCPLGPAIVPREEIEDVQRLRVRCLVDGESRQDASTAQMIFSVARLVAHCSGATTLEPGDVILTGTPAGVAMGRKPPTWLQPGQLCEVEIEGLGRIANRVVQGAAG